MKQRPKRNKITKGNSPDVVLNASTHGLSLTNLMKNVQDTKEYFDGLLGGMNWPRRPSQLHRDKVTGVLISLANCVFDEGIMAHIESRDLAEWQNLFPKQASPRIYVFDSDSEGEQPKTADELLNEAEKAEQNMQINRENSQEQVQDQVPEPGASPIDIRDPTPPHHLDDDDFEDEEWVKNFAEQKAKEGKAADLIEQMRQLGDGWVEQLKEGRLDKEYFDKWKDRVLNAVAWTDCSTSTRATLNKMRGEGENSQPSPTMLTTWAAIANEKKKPSLDEYANTPTGHNIIMVLSLHDPPSNQRLRLWREWWATIDWDAATGISHLASWFLAQHRDLWANYLVVNPSLLAQEKIALRLTTMINLINRMLMGAMPWASRYERALARIMEGKCGSVASARSTLQGILPTLPESSYGKIAMKPFTINFDANTLKNMDAQALRRGVGPALSWRAVPIGIQASEYWERFDNQDQGSDTGMETGSPTQSSTTGTTPEPERMVCWGPGSAHSSQKSTPRSPAPGIPPGRDGTSRSIQSSASAFSRPNYQQQGAGSNETTIAARAAASQKALERLKQAREAKRKRAKS